jgi:hypothetical protein
MVLTGRTLETHLNKKQIGGWMPFPCFLKSNFGCSLLDSPAIAAIFLRTDAVCFCLRTKAINALARLLAQHAPITELITAERRHWSSAPVLAAGRHYWLAPGLGNATTGPDSLFLFNPLRLGRGIMELGYRNPEESRTQSFYKPKRNLNPGAGLRSARREPPHGRSRAKTQEKITASRKLKSLSRDEKHDGEKNLKNGYYPWFPRPSPRKHRRESITAIE